MSHKPAYITVVTANEDITQRARAILAHLVTSSNGTLIRIETGPMANKRHQVTHVLNALARDVDSNKDTIVVFVDDHVWWPSPNFLTNLIAPFEDKEVGIVATNKRVQRERGTSFADSFLNFIACVYLERHNFEITAANAIDGGLFVVSGRTCAVRASIVMRRDFRKGFTNERFFFNMFGPLNPDDDNYITRFIVRNGWKIKMQNMGADTLVETTLGTTGGYSKFRGQLLRWARSQWRSNATTLFKDRVVWTKQPWSLHAIFITWFFNFALICDPLILYLWHKSNSEWITIYHMLILILGSKMVKLVPFFWHNPQDFWLFPFYVLFAYFHSFIKLWGLITFWDHSWGGRNLAAITAAPAPANHDNDKNDYADDDASSYQSAGSGRFSIESTQYADSRSTTPSLASFSGRSRSLTPVNTEGCNTFRVPSLSSTVSSVSNTGHNTFRVPDLSSTVSPASTQSSKTMSISSGGSVAQSPSSLASSNTMFGKYGKPRPGEITDGFTPESTFSTGYDVHGRSFNPNPNTPSIPDYSSQTSSSNKQATSTYPTPWGLVNTANAHITPANVRQSQSPSPPPQSGPLNTGLVTRLTETALNTFNTLANTISRTPSPVPSIVVAPVAESTVSSSFVAPLSTVNEDPEPLCTPATPPSSQNYGYTGTQEANTQATDLYTPTPFLSTFAMHTNDPSLPCNHSHHSSISPSPSLPIHYRTQYHPPCPQAPSPIPIIYKSTSPFPSSTTTAAQTHNATSGLGFHSASPSLCSSPDMLRQRQVYSREFVRGHDCNRVHADTSLLSAPLYFEGGRRLCRTPDIKWGADARGVVKGRPRF